MVVDFHRTNYFGENIVIVGTGNLTHDLLVSECENHFLNFPRLNPKPVNNKHTP
jgi:predicted Zn-dependent peptidase